MPLPTAINFFFWLLGWRLWQEGKATDLMDEAVRSSCNESEFLRCVHVGLLCVQEDPSDRPTMSDVVVMLSSETMSLPIPKQPAFFTRRTLSVTDSASSKTEINNEITTTIEEGRQLCRLSSLLLLFGV